MKTLLILRHAKSSWDNPNLVDYDRPLNKRGKRDAPRMGEHILEQDLVPGPNTYFFRKNVQEKTADKVAKACNFAGKIKKLDKFYHAPIGMYLENIADGPLIKHKCVMVVGHNPTMEHLTRHLTHEIVTMPTAALAHIELPIKNWDSLEFHSRGKTGESMDTKKRSSPTDFRVVHFNYLFHQRFPFLIRLKQVRYTFVLLVYVKCFLTRLNNSLFVSVISCDLINIVIALCNGTMKCTCIKFVWYLIWEFVDFNFCFLPFLKCGINRLLFETTEQI